MNDLKFAFRQLLKNPGFAAVAVLTLALGIGANTAIFSLINAALLRALPFPEANRLTVIWADNPGLKLGMTQIPPANADIAAWRQQSQSFVGLAAFSPRTADLADGGDPERVGAAGVTAGFFETLGVTPLRREGNERKSKRSRIRRRSEYECIGYSSIPNQPANSTGRDSLTIVR